ncbi:MAG: MFS transporter, partial [Acetobacteraceae bacterium]
GMVGHRTFHTRVGRNHRYDALGNALTGAAMGALGGLLSPRAPFFAAAALCLPALVALAAIRGRDINYERARSSEGRREPQAARWQEFLQNYRLLIFSGCLFLFQFSNASMLPLASERLNHNFEYESEFVLAALIVVPQLITAGLAAWVARKADEWGRKKLLIAGFGALVPRALLFAVAPGPWFLVGVQVLGGFTAIIIGIMTPLVVADVTRKSGRYNFALGATGMVAALGAALSTTLVGFIAQTMGYTSGFLTLAVAAVAAVVILWLFMPETSYEARRED